MDMIHFPALRPISAMLFTSKEVWIGTWRGLFRFDRKTEKIDTFPEISTLHIHQLRLSGHQLEINYQYLLNPVTRKVLEIPESNRMTSLEILYPEIQIENLGGSGIKIKRDGKNLLYI